MNKFLSNILLVGFSSLTINTLAQDFEVSPVGFDFNTMPGGIQTKKIWITNHSNSRSVFQIKIQDVIYDEEGCERIRPRGTTEHSAAKWLSVEPYTVEVDPNSQGVATLSMSVPSDGYDTRWCQIIVSEFHERSAFEADNNMGAGVNVTPEIVAWVTQTPKGFKENKVSITNFTEIEESEDQENRTFVVTIENLGKSIISGQLYIQAANMSSSLEEYKILAQNAKIYTGSIRKFKFKLNPGTLPSGEYDFSCILDMGRDTPLRGAHLKSTVTIE
ncbi:MAG: hypothetical protein IKQ46_11960 [Bacteroidales bacterium]|jgi:hypothetical protein|nr:hypothetical protein [Bacteroidales bacterium]